MNKFLVIPFEFRQASYYSLIMCKPKDDGTEYRITVMNGDLEKLLLGNNIIREINGYLHVETSKNDPQQHLKMEIAKSLVDVLKIPIKESFENG
jgi:hypothetical protein